MVDSLTRLWTGFLCFYDFRCDRSDQAANHSLSPDGVAAASHQVDAPPMKHWLLVALLCVAQAAGAAGSTCFGTVSHGSLGGGVQLPTSGRNFSTYSSLGSMLGRTYLHSTVRNIFLAAYSALEKSAPDKTFVYGETGRRSGGGMPPHRTHQNGTSVDFFVPVLDKSGHSVPLPTTVLNRFGYDIEFGADARYGELIIDFEAIGEHLLALQKAAKTHGASISLVIFDPRFMPRLFRTQHGAYLKKTLNFMQIDAWVRHDEHYHVDFGVTCLPAGD